MYFETVNIVNFVCICPTAKLGLNKSSIYLSIYPCRLSNTTKSTFKFRFSRAFARSLVRATARVSKSTAKRISTTTAHKWARLKIHQNQEFNMASSLNLYIVQWALWNKLPSADTGASPNQMKKENEKTEATASTGEISDLASLEQLTWHSFEIVASLSPCYVLYYSTQAENKYNTTE